MKQLLALILICVLLLAGCNPDRGSRISHDDVDDQETIQNPSEEESTKDTTQTEPPSEPETAPSEPVPIQPIHSELYLEGISVEDVVEYFAEVCLDSEFTYGGDPSIIQKWDCPIYYTVTGDYTDEDIATLERFTAWLNTVEGFPGIYPAPDASYRNLLITFGTGEDLVSTMGDDYVDCDGAVTYWYLDNRIYDATIFIRSDIDQAVRNSVIIEELYNGLGAVQDTALREDSIIYQGYSFPQWMTEVDELILRLLYHPDLLPGFDRDQCRAFIEALYF